MDPEGSLCRFARDLPGRTHPDCGTSPGQRSGVNCCEPLGYATLADGGQGGGVERVSLGQELARIPLPGKGQKGVQRPSRHQDLPRELSDVRCREVR